MDYYYWVVIFQDVGHWDNSCVELSGTAAEVDTWMAEHRPGVSYRKFIAYTEKELKGLMGE